MNKFIRSASAVCAAAMLMGSVPLFSANAETVTKPMYYAQADMGEKKTFNRVEIDFGGAAPDEYTVESSEDGTTWTEMENNSTEKNTVSNFTYNKKANNFYTYEDYEAKYVRVVSDENVSKVNIRVSETEDIAPLGSKMLFETNDGTDIKDSSTAQINARLNVKNMWASSYLYWGLKGGEYDFDEADIIIPLDGAAEISRVEAGSYCNNGAEGFINYFPKNYEVSYINSNSEVHAGTDGWTTAASGNASGKTAVSFDKVTATHVKLTLKGKGVTGEVDGKIATFLTYIGVYTAGENLVKNMTYGSFDTEVEAVDDMGEVDLVMFMGQSNMAGRGEATDSVVCPIGHGYEFRAISDPTRLYDAREPFGVNENNAASGVNEPGSKTGSMVSALMEEYYSYTGVPMVGISCSKGGSQVSFWQPGGAALNDAISRYKAAKLYLKNNGYTVRRKFMVWCQGESDADVSTPIADYKEMTQNMAQAMIDEGIEKCFMVRIGHKNDTSGKYDQYIEAQSELCAADDRFVMVSEKFADNQAGMKDLYHYHQSVYNEVGADAGKNIAAFYNDTTKNLPSTINIIDKLRTEKEAGVTIDGDTEGVVIAALYDKNGALEQIKTVGETEKATTVKFTTTENSKTIKLFNWKSLNEMEPIGESKEININSIDVITSATTSDFLYGSYSDDTKYEHAMPYRYFLPVNYDSSKEYPILMYLHGAGRRGNDNVNQLVNCAYMFNRLLDEENINKYPCIIVAPQCPAGEQWVDTPWGNGTYSIANVPASDEIQMAKDIILDFENRFSVDTNRVYIAGQSMGGYGTWDMIMRNPTMFAAAIPQCAAGDTTQAVNLKTMAIWAHHGEADDTVPLSGSRDMVTALKAAGSTNVRYTQYPSVGHEVQVETFKEPDILSWMFSKSLTTNAEVKDDYTYLKINDVLVREYTDENPRPVKRNDKVYVSASYVASELGMTYGNNAIAKGEKSLALTAENSITVGSAVMADSQALADTFGISVEFEEVSNTLGIKAGVQSEGALKIEAVTAGTGTQSDGTNADGTKYGPAAYATDGKTDTRWSASIGGSVTENTITFDLGARKSVSSVQIYFYAGDQRAYDFDINVSDDGQTWKKVKTFKSSGSKTGFEEFEFDNAVNARYVQYAGRGSTLANGTTNIYNSIWEFEIYGSDEPGEEPADPTVPDYLTIASAEADKSTQADNPASNAIDGDQSTRWSASVSSALPENTITFDLGESKCVSKVEIDFYGTNRVYDFDINVSNDGIKWKKVDTYTSKGKSVQNEYETFEFENPINTRYIQYAGRGSNNGANIYNSFWEFRAYGINTTDSEAENAPAARLAKITVERDDDATTYNSIGLKWTCETGEDLEEVKFYSVERVMDGVTEFKTDGEVSDTKYVDKGSSERPQYGPYEIDYEQKSNDGQYYIADLDQNKNPLSDAGKTTFIYEAYEGIPLVSGGEYGYIVKGYSANGELVAESELTKLKTKEKADTASIVFTGEPSTDLTGYNMSVSAVTKMELGTYGGISGWHFIQNEAGNQQHLGLKIGDESGLIGATEDTGYLVRITWADRFFNHAATARINLQRTANEQYNTENFNDTKNYIRTISGSGGENNKWYTMEFAYYGKNNHSLSINNALADIALNGYFAGQYGRFYIKSVEISKWDGPEERPFEVHMPSMFTDNMIIQRDKDINIWGRLDGTPKDGDGSYKAATVTAALIDNDTNSVVATNNTTAEATRTGDWTVTLDGQSYEADKTYRLEITAATGEETSEKTTINNVILGDVYLCAGQSNMRYGYEYPYWNDYHDDVDSGKFDNDKVRIISNENATVSNYWETSTTGWKESGTDSIVALGFSATASYFGKHLYEGNGNIPVGLISSAVGGAGIGTFLVNPVKDSGGSTLLTGNSVLYNRLIYPYTNWRNDGKSIGLAGIIWYQGEADGNPSSFTMPLPTYTKAMEQMVTDYRAAFNDDELPFMYVQLAAFYGVDYTQMREAQLNYMLGKNTNNGVPAKVGMAVITDNDDNIRDIHPRNKSEVGRRLSLWAQKLVYGQDIEYTGPVFKNTEATVADGKNALQINFDEGSVINGLKLKDNALIGLEIAGDNKKFSAPTDYKLSDDGKSLIVWSDTIETPEYVRYAYYQIPTDATIFNADGLPASAFRNYED